MKIGASYYPELSTSEQWKADLHTARALGLTALRCGEFAWSRLSPQPGQWQIDWASEFLDVAASFNFDVMWCTPSATPPPYLFDRWPDLNGFDENHLEMPVGTRRHYCPSHLGYRKLCGETAARLVRDLGAHPAIKGWQIDNEIAGDGFTCWCSRCNGAFQDWLEERYGTTKALNQAWKTDVWAQRYTQWNQILIPQKANASRHSPALRLAWRRFRSDSWLAFYLAQLEPMKALGVKQPITTNFFDLPWDIPFDLWAWRPYLDTISIGIYVENETGVRFECALLNGIDEKPLWVLEQKAGQQVAQNLYPESLNRITGHLQVCKEAGAEYSIYWHLRQHLSGCEMEHGAVLRHDGKATRIGQRVKESVELMEKVPLVAPKSSCVLVFDFDQNWAQDNRPQAGKPWSYREVLEQDWYGAALDLWQGCLVGPLVPSLQQADVILAPHFQLTGESDFEAIKTFLLKGGTFVTTADFGRLDLENNVLPLPPLGILSPLLTPPEAEMFHLKTDFVLMGQWEGQPILGRYFWFIPEQASTSHLTHDNLAGPAVLEFRVGSGRICILTSAFDRPTLTKLLSGLLNLE